jgi:hypothetical protein
VKTERIGIIMNGVTTKLRGRAAQARRRPVPPTAIMTAGVRCED